jgi:hypothetical protein
MDVNPNELAEFRRQVAAARSAHGEQWEASRRLVEPNRLPGTLHALRETITASPWSLAIKEAVAAALNKTHLSQSGELSAESLRQLTGLPAIKAIRALCLLLDLVSRQPTFDSIPALSPAEVEALVRKHDNPFDLLLASPTPSILDLGAGDLAFADELAAHYGPPLLQRGIPFVLHCVDRLDPASRLGGPLHPEASRLARLQQNPALNFRYVGDQNMFNLDELDRTHVLLRRYSIVTCWGPATPTFAYEPSRLADAIIQADLRRTKGEFRTVSFDREQALEVSHQGRFLLFPPWKFDIRGPLCLLRLMAGRGSLCILGAVDAQVFWEILAQLLEEPRARPTDRLFTPETLSEAFGDLYRQLSNLPIGRVLDLGEISRLRTAIPSAGTAPDQNASCSRFRHVRVRRGAWFDGMPASSTARLFSHMTEEAPPWFVTLVPEILPASP